MQISINGKTYEVPDGAKISIINDQLLVNGEFFEGSPDKLQGKIEIIVNGNPSSVNAQRGNVTVHGDCGPVHAGGNVTISKGVSGLVDAGGNVACGDVGSSVSAGGNITCGAVKGDVDAGGNIICKK